MRTPDSALKVVLLQNIIMSFKKLRELESAGSKHQYTQIITKLTGVLLEYEDELTEPPLSSK
jgi:hypothetical protein